MATIDPARALPIYQKHYGDLHNQILLRDIAIAGLEEENNRLRDQLASQGFERTPSDVTPPAPE